MATPDAYILTTRLRAPAAPTGFLERGDRFDEKLLGLTDETARGLKFVRTAVPLTREAYLTQISARPVGTIGFGFSLGQLVEWGILTQEEATEVMKYAQAGDEYRGYFIFAVKQGTFRRLEVRDETGHLARPQRFMNRDRAVAFIDGLHLQREPAEPA